MHDLRVDSLSPVRGAYRISTRIDISCSILGFTHVIPYMYPVYLTILLVYRSYRFEAYCRQKYGLTWEEYCKRVRYRIFPNVF